MEQDLKMREDTSPRPSPHAPHAEREKAAEESKAPVIPGVTFLDWNGTTGRAMGAIVRQAVSAEVMRSIYRRLPSEARLDMEQTRRLKVWAALCQPGTALSLPKEH